MKMGGAALRLRWESRTAIDAERAMQRGERVRSFGKHSCLFVAD
jgi:hypothetical protein